jgi:regulator of protease activity HflC (stomatin/prohibitin superfamily)
MELTSNTPDTRERVRWGWVTARPSEYLIVYRGGRLSEPLSGQGARFFKRPSDSYAVVPTTLKEVVFEANQITVDSVDVRLRGMVLYRITNPLRIYKLINFTRRQQAESKLARMIADMCRSTSKWLVANMKLDECIRRREEEIACSLKREVAAVATESWGVEIVSIDIQDVYVQDNELFQAMQATYKAARQQEAELAQLQVEQTVARQRVAAQRELAKHQYDLALETSRREAEAALARLDRQREQEAQQFELDRARVDREEALALQRVQQEQERQRLDAEARLERARIDAEVERAAHEEEIRALRARLEAESSAGRASLERLYVTEALPALAETLAASLQGARFQVYQGGDGAGGPLPFALGQLMDLLPSLLDRHGTATSLPSVPAHPSVPGNGTASSNRL